MIDFEKIYEEYFEDVFRYVISLSRNEHIAEEITQETFFKALKKIDQFKGDRKLRVWLCQIAKNTYFSYLKKHKNVEQKGEEMNEYIVEGFESKLIEKEASFEIHNALHDMEEPYKEVFSLRMFGELSFSQIGELFGKTESWARVTYHRAKLKLRAVVFTKS